jgi:hypothetical protein
VKSMLKAGRIAVNHMRTALPVLKVVSRLKAGRITTNHVTTGLSVRSGSNRR